MARIRRANVLLDVKDDEVGYYLNLGYDLLDDNGKVAKEAIPNDLHTLQKHYIDSNKKIAELEAEIAKLKADAVPKTEKVEKPATTRKKKTEE